MTQGSVGDCYLIAAMSSVATKGDRLEAVLNGMEKNKAGIYTFRMYIRGKPWLITVDDEMLYEY